MSPEEVIKLVLDLQNTQDPLELAEKLNRLKEATASLADGYQMLERNTNELQPAVAKLTAAEEAWAEEAMQAALAQRAVNKVLEESRAEVEALAGANDDAGFKGLATAVQKGEKAIVSLTSGHALGRLGGMLEGVLAPATGIPGIGIAIGSMVYAIEAVLPALEKWANALEGFTSKADKASEAIYGLNAAARHGPTRLKRAVSRIDSKIEAFETKEDEEGGLNQADTDSLAALRAASARGHDSMERDERRDALLAQQDEEVRVRHKLIDKLNLEGREGEAAWRKGMEQDKKADETQMTRSASQIEQWSKELARKELHDDSKATHQTHQDVQKLLRSADHAIHATPHLLEKLARERTHAARESTPEAINRSQQQEQMNQMLGIVQGNTSGFSAAQQHQIATEAIQKITAGADIAMAVQMAVAKIRTDFFRSMHRQQVASESFFPVQ